MMHLVINYPIPSSVIAVSCGPDLNYPHGSPWFPQFLSPLWSASKSRRISFKEHKDINQEAFTNALKREIVGHLDVMEQQIQQTKMDTYQKVQMIEYFANECDYL
jgi:hypothetical protein